MVNNFVISTKNQWSHSWKNNKYRQICWPLYFGE